MPRSSDKRVLIVAYHYPPEGGSSGVLRTLKLSKYLPENQWKPYILTLKESFYSTRDDTLASDIPSAARVYRTHALDTARHLAIAGRHLAFMSVPDRFIGWIPFAVIRGLQVIKNEKIELLYSTCPPPTAHLVAYILKRVTAIPWMADFRDPWIEEGVFPRPGSFRYKFEAALEKRIVTGCDQLVVTTPNLRTEFLGRYTNLAPDKVKVVYNGYDEGDFVGIHSGKRSEYFEIVHAGLITPEFRNPLPLLVAVAELVKNGEVNQTNFRIKLIGSGPWVSSDLFLHQIRNMGLDAIVRIIDRVSHREALQCMADAAVLLLLQASGDTRALIPAKAFEYLRIGRPILALTLPGATADLLARRAGCYTINPSDGAALKEALRKLYRDWKESTGTTVDTNGLRLYERRNLSKQMATLFDTLIAHGTVAAG